MTIRHCTVVLGPGADVSHLVLGEQGLGVQAAVAGLGVLPIVDRDEVARSRGHSGADLAAMV